MASSKFAAEALHSRLGSVLSDVRKVAEEAGRAPPRLVAVGKTFPAALTEACYSAGQRHFGENYIQELEDKSNELLKSCPEIRWHYVGHVQSNKIKKLVEVPNLWAVETLESKKHCELFQKHAAEADKNLNVFVQVNTSKEPQKGGVETNDLDSLVQYLLQECKNLTFKGLMTIGSLEESRNVEENADFERLRSLRADICKKFKLNEENVELSMGMTSDYALAIRYGSTNVRVGSAIFGERTYPDRSEDIKEMR